MKGILTYITFSAIMLGLTGCEGFLKKDPYTSQSNEITLSTYDGLNKSIAGVYYYIAHSAWYGNSWILNAEMRSGNGVKSVVRDSGRGSQPYNWNYTADATSGMWANCYITIAAVNNVIDNLEGKETSEITAQDIANLKAEALFLRAFAHFHCVLIYGQPYTYAPDSPGVPVVLHTDPAGKPARETVAKVYEQIVTDLLEAEEIMAEDYQRLTAQNADPKAYANINTIRAFLSRVYLYMGEWQKAADYATKVIGSQKYTMWTAEEYPEVWAQEFGTGEVIFEAYGSINNDSWASWEELSWLTDIDPKSSGGGDAITSHQLIKLYDEKDIRLTAGYKTTDDKNDECRMWTAKYPGKGVYTPDCNNVIIIRLSEMYLNRAEAIFNGATVAGVTVESDLNQITANRGVDPYLAATKLDIQTERRKELAWEGHYIYDLARWNKGVDRSDTKDFTLLTQNRNVEFPSYKWALPIPKSELEVNPNLVQNDGYEKN